jgi:predicted O-methyltransferase YrrM
LDEIVTHISSYKENNYGKLFTALVEIHQPELVVECGVLSGYSLSAMMDADLRKPCRFIGVDLFEGYPYKHCKYEEMKKFFHFTEVELRKKEAVQAAEDFEDESVDILHIDLSNNGNILDDMFDAWTQKIKKGGLVIFEGGSPERDKVEWMEKYGRSPIRHCKGFLSYRGFEYVTLLPYPSLTICRRGLK